MVRFLLLASLLVPTAATAQMRITEWQYNGDEFVELTNVAGHYDWSYAPEPDYDGTLEPGLFVEIGIGWSF